VRTPESSVGAVATTFDGAQTLIGRSGRYREVIFAVAVPPAKRDLNKHVIGSLEEHILESPEANIFAVKGHFVSGEVAEFPTLAKEQQSLKQAALATTIKASKQC
jgi:hypothetical protein